MTSLTPDQIAAEWSQRLSASTDKMRAGAQAVSVAPGQLAARQKTAYVQNVTARADKWAANVAAVPLSTWQNDFVTKGLPRVASGASQAQPKMAQFMGQFLPYLKAGVASLPARGNLDQNIARNAAMIRYNANFKRSGPRG